MAADPQAPDAQSDDLFGRWLAHHEQRSGDGDTSEEDVTPDHNPPPRTGGRLPAAAVASSAVASDPLIGSRLQPPSTFGARRTPADAHGCSGSSTAPDHEATAWEPIVMASARKKTDKHDKGSAKADPESTATSPEQRSRLKRLKARFVDPKEPTPEPEDPPETGEPVSRAPLPTRTPASPVRSIEETIRAAVPGPQVARHADAPAGPTPIVPPVLATQGPDPRPAEALEPLSEPEPITPTPVRSFIDATAPADQPDPVVGQPRPSHAAVAEPAPKVDPLGDLDLVVAESVVAEAEPELTVEPVAQPELDTVVEASVTIEPAPATYVERLPAPVVQVDPGPEPIAPVGPEPQPLAVVEPEPEPEPEREPEPAPTTVTADEPVGEPTRRRSLLRRAVREPKAATSPRPARTHRRDRPGTSGNAARELVAAKARARATEPAPKTAPKTAPEAEPEAEVTPGTPAVEAAPEPQVTRASRKPSKHDRVANEMPGVYTFKPRKTGRRLLTLALLIGLVLSAYFVKAAIDSKDTAAMGLAAIVLLATAMVWAIRAGAAPTRLQVHQGQLEVVRQGERYVFDLQSNYTHVEVRGRPGRHGWKVLFPRRGMPPFAVDATMVDPDDFMRVLRFFRPELVTS